MKPRNIIITIIVIVAGVFAGHFLGLYTLPFLTEEVNAISVLETTGTVKVERSSDNLAARAGMRLQERDTVRTASASTVWLSLDAAKAVQLSELTALRIDQGRRGFALTLVEGEIRAEIDKPLADNEDFTVQAGDLALAVRGTIFTVQYNSDIIWVSVERGLVAVLDKDGNELAVLGAGEGRVYGQKGGEFFEYEYNPGAEAPAPVPDDTPATPKIVEPLTPEQQTMVGVWEDEDRLVAVRQRMGRDGNPNYDFIFDAITYNNGTWIKVTRETCTFEIVGGKYVVTDIYFCPLPDDPGGNLYETNNILEYDPETDTMFFSESHVTQNGVQTWTRTLTRTGRDPETDPDVDWSDYYRIHPDRE
jgi:hypothetical protein